MDLKNVLAEALRISAVPIGVAAGGATGPAGAIVGPLAKGGIDALANQIDKEDDPETPKDVRERKRKRREGWVKFRLGQLDDIRDKLKQYPQAARPAIEKTLRESSLADLNRVILGEILETEDRIASDEEVTILRDAVAARAREKE